MIVGIIAEGSYPYVSGGVSTWLHQLMENMPDISFKILSIMPNQSDLPKYKYTLPPNVISVETLFMDNKDKKRCFMKRYNRLKKEDISLLESFVNFEGVFDWTKLVKLITSESKNICPDSILQGKPMWEHMLERYERDFSNSGFNSYIWTVKTMITPVFDFIKQINFEADVYHTLSTGYAGIVGTALKFKYEKPLILTEHGMYVREREQELLEIDWIPEEFKKMWIDFFYFMSLGCYKSSDLIISLYLESSKIQESHGAPSHALRIIPNGVDINKFTPSSEEGSGLLVGSIIRVVPVKDVETMLRAFKIVLQSVPDVRFQIVGPYDEDKEYYDHCKSVLDELSIGDKVDFTGQLDITTVITDFDIMVFTSRSEGQPLAILEGMASGVPIVATDVGDCLELIAADSKENSCGIITEPDSPTRTADAILKLIDDKELRKTMGQNGVSRAKDNYDIDKLIERYKEIYNSFAR